MLAAAHDGGRCAPRMRLRVIAVLGTAVGRDVAVESRLACWSQDRERHAGAAVTTIAASPTAAETVAVWRPATGKVARLERQVRVKELGIARSGRTASTGRCAGALPRPGAAAVLSGSRHGHRDGDHGGKRKRGM